MDLPPSTRVWSEFLAVLAQLPPTTRAVFLLHVVFDASDMEVERLTGVGTEACAQHLQEARRVVRAAARAQPDPIDEKTEKGDTP